MSAILVVINSASRATLGFTLGPDRTAIAHEGISFGGGGLQLNLYANLKKML